MELWRKKSVHVDYKKRPQWSFGGKKGPRRLQKGAPVELWKKKASTQITKKGPQWSFGGKKRSRRLQKGAPVELLRKKNRPRKLQKRGPNGPTGRRSANVN